MGDRQRRPSVRASPDCALVSASCGCWCPSWAPHRRQLGRCPEQQESPEPARDQGLCDHTSRVGGIRTHDLFVPKGPDQSETGVLTQLLRQRYLALSVGQSVSMAVNAELHHQPSRRVWASVNSALSRHRAGCSSATGLPVLRVMWADTQNSSAGFHWTPAAPKGFTSLLAPNAAHRRSRRCSCSLAAVPIPSASSRSASAPPSEPSWL